MQLETEVDHAAADGDRALLLNSSGSRARGKFVSPWLCAFFLLAAGAAGRGVLNLCGRRTGTSEVISLSGSGVTSQLTTVTVDVALLGAKAGDKEEIEEALKKAISLRAGVQDSSVSCDDSKLGGDLPVMKVAISVPPGSSADGVISKLRDGVDVSAEIDKELKAANPALNTPITGVYSSAVTQSKTKPVRQAQSQRATVVVDMVVNGIDLNPATTKCSEEQKNLVPKAVQVAITSKAQVPAGDMLIVISPTGHVTASLSVAHGTENATMSRLQNGADVAGEVETKLKADFKAIPNLDDDCLQNGNSGISVYTSYLKHAPVRKFFDKKIKLNFVLDDMPADPPTDDDVKRAVKEAIVSKGLESDDVEISYGNNKGSASISVPHGTDADARKSTLQSDLQQGADVAVSIEQKLKGLPKLKDVKPPFSVYTSPLKLDNVAGLVVDLIVDGIDFGKLEQVPGLLVKVANDMKKEVKDEADEAAGCTVTLDDVVLLFPSDMTTSSVSVQAQITKPDADACKADTMMAELQTVACEVQKDLQAMTDLKWFTTKSVTDIVVRTPDDTEPKKTCA